MKLDKFTVGKRYGKALFELARERQSTKEVYAELLKLREIYGLVPDLGNILSDVRLEPHEKDQIFANLVQGFTGLVHDFLQVVYNYNRMNDCLLMIDEYERLYDEENGLILGTVTTAVPLTEKQHDNIEKKVADLLGYKKAELQNIIDQEIVGGVIVEANHRVIDGSVSTQLIKLRNILTK